MNEFLKFAYELIAQVIYNLTDWVVAIVDGFIRLFITGWGEYSAIVGSYFPGFNILSKVLSIFLIVILLGIPAGLIYILVRKIVLNIRLKTTKNDRSVLYREIGRLNQQVLDLMDDYLEEKGLLREDPKTGEMEYLDGDVDETEQLDYILKAVREEGRAITSVQVQLIQDAELQYGIEKGYYEE